MKAIRHAGIVVSDLRGALHFYQDLLGLKIVKRMDEEGEYTDKISGLKNVKVTTVKMAAEDGNLIELLYYQSHPELPINKKLTTIGAPHVAFTVEDVDKEFERLSKEGIQFNSPPQVSPDNYAKVVFCQDPDGVFIELVEVLKK